MAFERNDIVNKTRLAGELGEELMGFEHNDIVTVDVMNKAIEEGGGGGGDIPQWHVTVNTIDTGDDDYLGCCNVTNYVGDNEVLQLAALVDGKPCLYATYPIDGTTQTVDIAVWDDTATFSLDVRSLAYCTVSATGDIEFVDDEGWHFHITGDGTITFTAI